MAAIPASPWWAKNAQRSLQVHSGPINSPVAGRTDHIPLHVASGSYVVPADIVSGLGEGNTAAGHNVIKTMFHSDPYGLAPKSMPGAQPHIPKVNLTPPTPQKFANGGAIPIMAAGGEHVLTPEQVAMAGAGDINHGHEVLDEWVKHQRKKINTEQKKLPGPAKD